MTLSYWKVSQYLSFILSFKSFKWKIKKNEKTVDRTKVEHGVKRISAIFSNHFSVWSSLILLCLDSKEKTILSFHGHYFLCLGPLSFLERTYRECSANKYLLLTFLSYFNKRGVPLVSQGQSLCGLQHRYQVTYVATYYNEKKNRNVSLHNEHHKNGISERIYLGETYLECY